MCSTGHEAIRTKPNMPVTKVIKPETVATSRKSMRESTPVRVRQGAAQLRVRSSRASSCPRCPQVTATQPGCKRKTRFSSSSTAPAPATRPARAQEASGYQREPQVASVRCVCVCVKTIRNVNFTLTKKKPLLNKSNSFILFFFCLKL